MVVKISHRLLKASFMQLGAWLLLVSASLLLGASAAFAGGSAGTVTSPTEPATGTCLDIVKRNPNGIAANACGAGFTKHSVDNIRTWPWLRNNDASEKQQYANECKSAGATEVYILAVHRTKLSSNGAEVVYLNGQFSRWIPVHQLTKQWVGGNGGTPYLAGYGALSFDEVRSDHTAALNYAKNHPEGFEKFLATSWENVTYFCWNPAWENTTSSFDSWSFVDEMSTASTGPDSKVTKEITTTEEEVTVTFKHQFSYNKPTAPEDSTFGPASTNWRVDVTEDGNRVSGYSQRPFTLNNSGPNRSSIWDDMPYLGETTYTVKMPEGVTSKTVCSKITYSPKTILWDENPAKQYKMNYNESNGQEDSEACVIVKRDPTQLEPGDYTSTTTVHIPAQGGDIHEHQLTSEEDGTDNNILISTDQADVNVEFWHEIIWHGSKCPPEQPDGHHDACDQHASTPFTITTETGSQSGSGTHSGDTGEEGREPVTVHLEKGETKKVCRRITYTQKNIPFQSYPKLHGSGLNAHYHTHYKIVNPGGTGYSEACATITRPADPYTPSTPDTQYKVQGPSSGGNDATPMFAGETAPLSWEGGAVTYDVRRLMEWQAISYQVPVTTAFNSSISLGNIGDAARRTLLNDPCTWYRSKTGWRGCAVSASSSASSDEHNGSNGEHKYVWSDGQFTNQTASMNGNQATFKEPFKTDNFGETIVVPNLVGDKHCNSFGFQFQYYYAYVKEGVATWYKDTDNPPYWTVYDAACRTIAKKPSVAVWNGGIMTGNGGITTSLANRYDNTNLNTLVSGGGTRTSFGSWTEYLAVINGEVVNFSSGTVLAGGSASSELLANSPLTISNRGGSVSPSLIGSNTILASRLQDYLFSNADINSGTTTSSAIGLSTNQTGTTIVNIDGKLTIDSNIELSSASHSSIYSIPQVVIYARDGIDIRPNVTRIDAWLVTGGTIDTCTSFVKPTTEARVNGWSRNVTCENSLVVNGPVFARNVKLNRTYGADGYSNGDTDLAGSGDTRAATGEVFNLSADTYLWAYAQSGRYGSSYSEAYSRELPPRY